jgi:membrane associated rhomboid family serine protease
MPGRYRFSMPSNRDRTDPWFRLGHIDVTSTVLVAFISVVSFFVYAASPDAIRTFQLLWFEVRNGQLWRLLTWPLANEPSIWVAFAILIFWYLGSQIESRLGRVRYLWLLVLVTVLPGILGTLLEVSLGGIRAIELAIFVVFACEYPRTPFFFGIPAWILAVVFVGIDILQLLGQRESDHLIVYIASIATAIWTARSFGMLTDFQWLPQIRLPKRRRTAPKGVSRGRSSTGHVVVDGPWPTTPVYKPMQDQAEVDQILDKIAVVGMDGLTADEKKRLNDASKRLRKGGS